MIGIYGADGIFTGKLIPDLSRFSRPHKQVCPQLLQLLSQIFEAAENEFDTPVGLIFQLPENFRIENKQGKHWFSLPERMIQAGIIIQPEVPPELEDNN
jgi:hypothetical protein